MPWLQQSGCWHACQRALQWFEDCGFRANFVAGFSPIPCKVFTVAAGGPSMALLPFTLASIIGRGGVAIRCPAHPSSHNAEVAGMAPRPLTIDTPRRSHWRRARS
jgi:hypothetical protein